jgi:hypothetical protein
MCLLRTQSTNLKNEPGISGVVGSTYTLWSLSASSQDDDAWTILNWLGSHHKEHEGLIPTTTKTWLTSQTKTTAPQIADITEEHWSLQPTKQLRELYSYTNQKTS